jgi:hypothetical protein
LQKPEWKSDVARQWNAYLRRNRRAGEGDALRMAVSLLARAQEKREGFRTTPSVERWVLPEQPFDRLLLESSRLFQRSRKLYRWVGGGHRPALLSTPRSLSSPTLLIPMIQYSPTESELIWMATDPAESRQSDGLLGLRTWTTSLFHEQNHRTLWALLPPPPSSRKGVRKYLNFAEALVIATDMALGDELGPELARMFYLVGTVYDPGTEVRAEIDSRRLYRNYLHAAVYASYLVLELFEEEEVRMGVRALYPQAGEFGERAVTRAGRLDRSFLERTNPE